MNWGTVAWIVIGLIAVFGMMRGCGGMMGGMRGGGGGCGMPSRPKGKQPPAQDDNPSQSRKVD